MYLFYFFNGGSILLFCDYMTIVPYKYDVSMVTSLFHLMSGGGVSFVFEFVSSNQGRSFCGRVYRGIPHTDAAVN